MSARTALLAGRTLRDWAQDIWADDGPRVNGWDEVERVLEQVVAATRSAALDEAAAHLARRGELLDAMAGEIRSLKDGAR